MSALSNSLNYIRPSYTEPYMPKATSAHFFSWVNLNIKRTNENITPKMHYQMVDELIGTSEINVQAMVHRGGAKSTVLTNYLPLYVAAHGMLPNFGVVHNLIIFSATIEQAIEQLKSIKDMWDANEILHEFLKLAKNKDGSTVANKVDYIAWENQNGHVIHIQAKGAGQSMRGTSKGAGNHRPDLLVFDDILVDNILTSETERKKLKTWYYSTVANSVNVEHYKKIVVGTPMTSDDLLMIMLNSPEYKSVKFPVADVFPVPEEDIISSWVDRFTPARIMQQFREAKSAGAEADFYREMMLEVINDDMRLFESEYFKYYKYKDLKPQLGAMNIFTSLDLAVSQKKSADYTSIITIAVDKKSHWYIVKATVARLTPHQVIDEIFKHVKMFNPLEVRAEKAALQQVLDAFIDARMLSTRTTFNYRGLENNTVISKEYRISALQPKMRMGHIHFPTDIDQVAIAELEYEMKGYTKVGKTTAHDDAVDSLANFLDPDFVIAPTDDQGSEISGDEHSDLYQNDDVYMDEYDY